MLESAGLISRGRRDSGVRVDCAPQPLQDVTGWLDHYRRFWEASFDRLEEHLRQVHDKEGANDG